MSKDLADLEELLQPSPASQIDKQAASVELSRKLKEVRLDTGIGITQAEGRSTRVARDC